MKRRGNDVYLRDYLQDIPLRALKTMADTLELSVEYRARIKLVNAIDMAFWDGTLTRRLMSELTGEQRRVLSMTAFAYNAGVRRRTLASKMGRLSALNRAAIRSALNILVPRALVGGIVDDDPLYFCPGTVGEQVRRLLLEEVISLPAGKQRRPMSYPTLLEDIYSFMTRVYADTIPLTIKDRVRKKTLDRIFEGSDTTGDPALTFTAERRNAFIVEYLGDRGLIEAGDRRFTASIHLRGWLEMSLTRRLQDIVAFALSSIVQDMPTVVTLAGMFSEMPAGASFDAHDLSRFIHNGTVAPGGVSRIEGRLRHLLAVCTRLGLFAFTDGRFELTEAGEIFWHGGRLPLDDNMGETFTIQPNFEIIVGPELLPRIRFMLGLMCTRKNRDTVSTYEVTQQGIAKARERGLSTVDIIAFFERHSRNPLPQNVRFSLENWGNNYGSIYFEKVVLMRLDHSEALERVRHMPEVEPHIVEELTDTVFIVREQSVPAISGALKKAGFHPQSFGEMSPDPLLFGESYAPESVAGLVSSVSMPDLHHDFMFPAPEEEEHDQRPES